MFNFCVINPKWPFHYILIDIERSSKWDFQSDQLLITLSVTWHTWFDGIYILHEGFAFYKSGNWVDIFWFDFKRKKNRITHPISPSIRAFYYKINCFCDFFSLSKVDEKEFTPNLMLEGKISRSFFRFQERERERKVLLRILSRG